MEADRIIEVVKSAFHPYEVAEAKIYDYDDKLSFKVLLPEPHKTLALKDWPTDRSTAEFIDRLESVRDLIRSKGLPLDPWEPPAPPTQS